jgi:hypothetical protein
MSDETHRIVKLVKIGAAMLVAIYVGIVLNHFGIGPEVYVPVQVALFLGGTV